MAIKLFLITMSFISLKVAATPVCEDGARTPEQVTSDFLITSLQEGILKLEDLENFVAQPNWSNPYRAKRSSPDGLSAFNGFAKASRKMNDAQRERTKILLRTAFSNEITKVLSEIDTRDNTKWVIVDPTLVQEFAVPGVTGSHEGFKASGNPRRSAHGWVDGRPVFVETYIRSGTNINSEYFDALFDPFHPDPAQRFAVLQNGFGLPVPIFKIFERDGRSILVKLFDHSSYDLKERKLMSRNPIFDKDLSGLTIKDAFQAGPIFALIADNGSLTILDTRKRDNRVHAFPGNDCVTYKFHKVGSRHLLTCYPSKKDYLYIFDIDAGKRIGSYQSRAANSTENKIILFEEDGEIYFTQFEFNSQRNLELVKIKIGNHHDRPVIANVPLPSNVGTFSSTGEGFFFVEGVDRLVVGSLKGGPISIYHAPRNNLFKETLQFNGEPLGYRMGMLGAFEIQSISSGSVVSRHDFNTVMSSQGLFTYQGNFYGFFIPYDKGPVLMRIEKDTNR